MKKISRKTFLVGGAAAAAAAAGACLCTKTGRATISGVSATPEISPGAYDIGEDKSIRICLDKVPQLALVGGFVKILNSTIDDSFINCCSENRRHLRGCVYQMHAPRC
jgi:hypothetical protein